MQIHTDGTKYDQRVSADGRYSYSISYNPITKWWDVDCWEEEGEYAGENHWHIATQDEAKALFEFNRFP